MKNYQDCAGKERIRECGNQRREEGVAGENIT